MNTNSAIFTDPRAKRWGNFVKWAAILVVGFFVAPFIWIAIGGLIGLIVAAIVLTTTWMLRPWFYSVAANLRLKLIKNEARKNPVETLEEDLRSKHVTLEQRKTNIELLNGQIRSFADSVDEILRKYGKEDPAYIKLNEQLSDLKRIYKHRVERWNEALKQLNRFAEEIERAKIIWEAGLAASAARETSGLTEDEFFAKLRTETAFDAIQDNYNQALASLDTAMLDSTSTKTV